MKSRKIDASMYRLRSKWEWGRGGYASVRCKGDEIITKAQIPMPDDTPTLIAPKADEHITRPYK